MVMRVDRAPVGLSRTAQLEELPYSQSQRGRGNPVLSLCSIFPFLFLCLLVICLFLFFLLLLSPLALVLFRAL